MEMLRILFEFGRLQKKHFLHHAIIITTHKNNSNNTSMKGDKVMPNPNTAPFQRKRFWFFYVFLITVFVAFFQFIGVKPKTYWTITNIAHSLVCPSFMNTRTHDSHTHLILDHFRHDALGQRKSIRE
jgi:hypothetical protein